MGVIDKSFTRIIRNLTPSQKRALYHSGAEQSYQWLRSKAESLKLDLEKVEDDLEDNNLLGELTLIMDMNFKFIDENWSINIDSPLLIT